MADAAGTLEARDVCEAGQPCYTGPFKPIKGMNNLDWGMRNRLSRLIKAHGHTQFMPIDHGYFQGPARCLKCPGQTIKDLCPTPTACSSPGACCAPS